MQKFKALYVGILAIFLAGILFGVMFLKQDVRLISAIKLQSLLEQNLPEIVTIKGEYLYFTLNGQRYKIAKESVDLQALGQKVPLEIKEEWSLWRNAVEIIAIFGAVFMVLLFFFAFKQSKIAQSKPKPKEDSISTPNVAKTLVSDAFALHHIKPISSNVTFADVAGISEAKNELEEIIDYLKSPKKYQDFGVKLPKGVLLVGVPGVGKTLIAKALAGEAQVPFFYQSGASFVQIYVGMGAKRVHDLFTKAKLNAPSIVFIDEIDAVGKARGNMRNDEREATLNQLLTEMDGFEDSSGVIVIGATNNMESLDEALLRSGRFDRRIFVELPNLQERIKILQVHTRNKRCDFDYEEISKLCVGFSGAALASLINEAALCAIKRGSEVITKEDILSVRDKVMLGVRKKLSFSDKEREILAYYQAAKAFSAYALEVPFEKITLMSDGLKYADKEFLSKNEMESQIKIHLSGIAALELLFEERYSHAKVDLDRAKTIAHKMAESYGMGEYLLGREEDVLKILENCKNERFKFFKNYRLILDSIKNALLTNEKLEYVEVGNIINA
ncbi:ATP-dependent metallopeptidase FtsH/Yme1/Tma family protein [Helicobacter sp.]|uniref:ATP-dependent metallopeptidase FtsH/Yme1/Tma family protein n=1 Tax=Helicobacter sp. TaxID=218 RepID=UPI0025C4C512|nr:ATP-dependent metallopeptidase FtsH/Yme1/Tma family protein [Helicobacter sp.]MCI5968454.1 ATP-dependent metallopeptidase FtsH/Yme1/Tma family protein [Helicobacter sp.]MDY2585239.1 ATP-dependent metallopeptidase FtsH/Yme1/Tma family protein [Helicobacter sp.]